MRVREWDPWAASPGEIRSLVEMLNAHALAGLSPAEVRQLHATLTRMRALSPAPVIFQPFGLPITNTILAAWLAIVLSGVYGVVAYSVRRRERGVDRALYWEMVVEQVQEIFHDGFIHTTWPPCPRHHQHPLWLHGEYWMCEQDDVAVARLGELPSLGKGE